MVMLIPVKLRGVGTHDIESLGSYIHNLARVHGVTVNRLLDYLYKCYEFDLEKDDASHHNFCACGTLASLCRPRALTQEVLKVLEYSSIQKNLSSSTLMAIYNVLDRSVSDFSNSFRWCPSCMYEFELAEDPGYFKLIWQFKSIKLCPEHRVKLITTCSKCDSLQDGYGLKGPCTQCRNCGSSLGFLPSFEDIHSPSEISGIDCVHLVAEIARNPCLEFPKDGVRNILNSTFDTFWDSNQEDLLWKKIPRDEFLHITCGNSSITLTVVRRFAARLGVQIVDLLEGELNLLPENLSDEWFKEIPQEIKPKKRTKRYYPVRLLEELKKYLSNANGIPPMPLTRVAQEIGASVGLIHHHFPELANQIIENYEEWRANERQNKRRLARVEALNYFITESSNKTSLKRALAIIREKTGLPKNMLREEIKAVHNLIS